MTIDITLGFIIHFTFTVNTYDGIFTYPSKTKCREYPRCAQCTVFPTQDRNF